MMRRIFLPAAKKLSEKYQQFHDFRNKNASSFVVNSVSAGAVIGTGVGVTSGLAITGSNSSFFKLNSVGKVAVRGGAGFAIGSTFMAGVSCLALCPEALTMLGIAMLLKLGRVKMEENNNTKSLTCRK